MRSLVMRPPPPTAHLLKTSTPQPPTPRRNPPFLPHLTSRRLPSPPPHHLPKPQPPQAASHFASAASSALSDLGSAKLAVAALFDGSVLANLRAMVERLEAGLGPAVPPGSGLDVQVGPPPASACAPGGGCTQPTPYQGGKGGARLTGSALL